VVQRLLYNRQCSDGGGGESVTPSFPIVPKTTDKFGEVKAWTTED
jgi:hypothetical protein